MQKLPPLGGMPPSKEAITLAIAQYEAKMQVRRLMHICFATGFEHGHVADRLGKLLFPCSGHHRCQHAEDLVHLVHAASVSLLVMARQKLVTKLYTADNMRVPRRQMEMEEAARLQLREREGPRAPSAARTAFESTAPMQVPSSRRKLGLALGLFVG